MEDYRDYGMNEGILGGYIDGEHGPKKYLAPEVSFQVEMQRVFEVINNHGYIEQYEMDKIMNNIDKINYYLFKNPVLIILSYIVVRDSNKKKDKKDIDPQILNKVYTNPHMAIFNNDKSISKYNLLRYSRHMLQYMSVLFQ